MAKFNLADNWYTVGKVHAASLGAHTVSGLLVQQPVEDEDMWHRVMEQIHPQQQDQIPQLISQQSDQTYVRLWTRSHNTTAEITSHRARVAVPPIKQEISFSLSWPWLFTSSRVDNGGSLNKFAFQPFSPTGKIQPCNYPLVVPHYWSVCGH